MRISCPNCGARDLREFYYRGAASALERPLQSADEADWDAYLHLRENPEGLHDELWQHEYGCQDWLVVTRNTKTHEISQVRLAKRTQTSQEAS